MLYKLKRGIVLFLTFTLVVLAGCVQSGGTDDTNGSKDTIGVNETVKPESTKEGKETDPATTETIKGSGSTDNTTKTPTDNQNEGSDKSSFEVHFIDCGQGDSILLLSEGKSMLIDAANNKDGEAIVKYLKDQGVKTLDFVVGTHPDADHIGGLDTVINSFSVGKVFLPKKQNNTKTFEDLLNAISDKGLKITSPKPGTEITLGAATLTILGPMNYYEDDNNNNSIVIRAAHGENSFLFMGDAGLQEETDLMESGATLQATVLKVGHHGSNSSTSRFFLEEVKPVYAVISCGVDNQYGHPHKETLNYLDKYGVITYRTDLQKTIIMKSDGKKLTFTTDNPSAIGEGAGGSSADNKKDDKQINEGKDSNDKNASETSYIGNKNSKKFHLPSCDSLPKESNRVYFSTRDKAVGEGYDPCGKCNP